MNHFVKNGKGGDLIVREGESSCKMYKSLTIVSSLRLDSTSIKSQSPCMTKEIFQGSWGKPNCHFQSIGMNNPNEVEAKVIQGLGVFLIVLLRDSNGERRIKECFQACPQQAFIRRLLCKHAVLSLERRREE
ncbi:uncharacterized protein LOC131248886 [Magnolia sinica]|uniref:uncharacterized protein LOC131248886 n=1 Tax=Magnolia sinica TaxID=86752 RepID=UPI0026581506|nr:uncharacterized protein LOC131248886 [Magnolia sinica]